MLERENRPERQDDFSRAKRLLSRGRRIAHSPWLCPRPLRSVANATPRLAT
jgi:hypothetical protein